MIQTIYKRTDKFSRWID